MKILCIAPEHSDVLAVTSTLPELSPGLSLSWAERFEDAAYWIFHNRDLAALVLDAQFGHEPCAALLANLHKRGLGAPTIVVGDLAPTTSHALGLGPADCLLPRSTLVRDLPAAINRIIEKRQPALLDGDTLKAQLARAEAAFREAGARHALEIRAAGDRLADRERVLAAEIATLTASHEVLERRCVDADVAIQAARDSERRVEQVAAEQLTRLDREWRDALARELSARQSAEATLSRVERDRAEVNAAHASAMAELGTRLREQETRVEAERSSSEAVRAHLQHQLDEATNARRALEARLAHVTSEIDDARTRHASETAEATDRFAKQEQAFAIRMAELAAARDALDARCATVQAARDAERTRAARAADAAAAEAAAREGALSERLLQEVALREDAERIRTSLERIRAEADAQHTTALSAAVEQIRGRDAQIESERAAAQAAYRTFTEQLQSSEQARREAVEAAAREQAVLASRFSEREQALASEITRLAACSQALESRCASLSDRCAELDARCGELNARQGEAEAALAERDARLERQHTTAQTEHAALAQHLEAAVRARDEAEQSAVRAHQSAAERLAEREQILGRQIEVLDERVGVLRGQIADVVVARDGLAQRLTDANAALGVAQTQATQDATTAAARAAEREREWEARAAATRAAHDEALAAAAATLTAREAQHVAAHTAAEATLADLEQRIRAAEQARLNAEESASRDRLAADAQLAKLRTELEATKLEGVAAERALERQLASVVADSEAAKTTHAAAMSDAAERSAAREQALNAQLAEAVAEHVQSAREASTRERTLQDSIAAEIDKRHAVERALEEAERARDAARQHADAMATVVAEADERRQQLETQLAERTNRLDALGRDLAELRASLTSAREESARLLREQEAECERTEQLRASHAAAMQRRTSEHADAVLKLETEVERLRCDVSAATRDATTTREERDALKIDASQANRLQRDLDRLRAETEREFNQHPLPLLRCDRDGTLTLVNRAFAQMVGHASDEDAQRLATATDLFRGSNDLRWLVERSRTAGIVTQAESTLHIGDGRCLVVRLLSSATPSGAQVVVQDLTPQRAAQGTLDQARRLEAVGRLGTEVAVTSSHVLRDVCRDGERWLSAFDGTTAIRRRVELLLGEVARAAGLLDQLTAFGEQQANVISSVDLHRVLHDMGPVLRQIAGDEIEIVLPNREQGSAACEVDVEADRVERLLVNVASYCRDRIPTGGSMRFELTPTIVDRAFVEKYPAVRPGPHVVLTVAEVNGPIRLMGPSTYREELAIAHDDGAIPSGGVGVELTALQALVRGCHGHLWVDAARTGDLTIRIHLPLKVA